MPEKASIIDSGVLSCWLEVPGKQEAGPVDDRWTNARANEEIDAVLQNGGYLILGDCIFDKPLPIGDARILLRGDSGMSDDDICISIEGVSHPILCGSCKSKVAFIGEADADGGDVGCADCGNVADVQEVAAMAIEYAKDEMQLVLNRMASDTARKSKIMTFKGQTSHYKAHRFVVDMKL